jgi:ankyrin repeat protein
MTDVEPVVDGVVEEVEKPDPRTFRPDLYEAAKSNDTTRVLQYLSDGVPPSYIDAFNGWTALHWASCNGNIVMVKKLLEW